MPHWAHQGDCTVCWGWTTPCGKKYSACCPEPWHALWNKIYHVSILDSFRSVAFTVHMKNDIPVSAQFEEKEWCTAIPLFVYSALHRNTDVEVCHGPFLSRTFHVSSRRSHCVTSTDSTPRPTTECSVILRDIFMLMISSTAVLLYLNLKNSSVM